MWQFYVIYTKNIVLYQIKKKYMDDLETLALGALIATDEELGGAPSEGVDVASISFPSFNEPRFIEPVGP